MATDNSRVAGSTSSSEEAPKHLMSDARSARIVRSRSMRRAMLAVARTILNPFVVMLATRAGLKGMAVVHHQGRRSGRAYATPASARPVVDGFIVPMTFGPKADWVQNLQAAGGGAIEWAGVRYPVVDPEVLDFAAGSRAFGSAQRVFLRILGMENFVHLRKVTV